MKHYVIIFHFANENIIHSTLPLKSPLNQIVRTQSERCPKNCKPRICLTKSYSFSTNIHNTKISKIINIISTYTTR